VELIAVHDAVRPLTPTPLIDAVFAAAAEHGAALLAVPLADTLKRVDAATQTVTATIPRAGLWQAQTPQVFRRDWLRDAYARRSSFPGSITDDAQLVEAAGHPVRVVAGSPVNFKITTKDDLALADAILKSREAKPAERPTHAFDDEAKW
jgi:2-C-methyl-D-erythritol 4-phosphate cytidylyltransferase